MGGRVGEQIRFHRLHQQRASLVAPFTAGRKQGVEKLFRLKAMGCWQAVAPWSKGGLRSRVVSHTGFYFPEMYCSMAMVIEGAFGVGAAMSTRNLFSVAAFSVVGPNVAMHVVPCSKSGKFLYKLSMPLGL